MSRGSYRILVVDDSPIDRLMLSSILKKEGFQTLAASNGAEGLQQARDAQPDIILLDVLMPGENGFETCSKIKKDPSTSSIPVIFLSSANDKNSRISGLTGGAVDYITKPFETEEVLARLRIHLRIKEAFEALIEQQKSQLSQLTTAQQSILIRPEDLPEANFAVYYRPLHAAGGDFYDVIPLGDGIIGVFSADICGHDLGAAFVTSALKALLRQNFTPLYTPQEVMVLLNSVLLPVLGEGVMISACCARLNRRSERLVLVDAGHPPIIHLGVDGSFRLLEASGDLLGAFDAPYFDGAEVKVSKGDRLIFFSDGLIENHHGQTVSRAEGLRLLTDAVLSRSALPLADLVNGASQAICMPDEYAGDDLLMLGMEV